MKLTLLKLPLVALVALLLTNLPQTATAASLQAYTFTTAGQRTCGTGGSSPDANTYGFPGVGVVPYYGSGCNAQEVIQDVTQSSGTAQASSASSATHLGPYADGAYSGSAAAKAQYGYLGTQLSGTFTGTTQNSTTDKGAEAAAIYRDNLTINSAGLTGQSATFIETFTIDGSITINGHGSAQIGFYVNTGGSGWIDQFRLGGVDGLTAGNNIRINSHFVTSYPGLTISTTTIGANVQVTFSEPVILGTPFDIAYAFDAYAIPDAYSGGTSVTSVDFLSSARLTGISLFRGSTQLNAFSIASTSGTVYDSTGVSSAPEPATLLLAAAGLAAAFSRRRKNVRP